ncbi:type II toxin-antitoxin system RelE/ParE family toxin [Flavobacterium caeni]|uniref:Phage derived protein Gp49-like n=1 Tax=Flavobacterium caeni TaxID=490189 RepID=A0A1G5KQL2_9FLAO|nr:type II toxin-antitoxin system RelE/ParE family toxin [Flavobacterium caeni]SCZ02481.1 Phage derived protein Gp49-like [Flavobacterium caeni]
MEKVREIIFYENYFFEFYNAQNGKVQDKIDEILFAITVLERIPRKFFEHMTGTNGLYEIRIELGGNIFRVFCCFDEGKIIVLFNGFQKKTQKTPKSEIEKAEKLKEEYFKTKNEHGKRK